MALEKGEGDLVAAEVVGKKGADAAGSQDVEARFWYRQGLWEVLHIGGRGVLVPEWAKAGG